MNVQYMHFPNKKKINTKHVQETKIKQVLALCD